MNTPQRPFTILISALGGEGGGVLAGWIVDAATAQGYPVQNTSIPGLADGRVFSTVVQFTPP